MDVRKIMTTDGSRLYDGDMTVPWSLQSALAAMTRYGHVVVWGMGYETLRDVVEQMATQLPPSNGRGDGVTTAYNTSTHFYSARVRLGGMTCEILDMGNVFRDDTTSDLADTYGGASVCEALYEAALSLESHGMRGPTISAMAMHEYVGRDYAGFKQRFPALSENEYRRMRPAYFGAYVDAVPGEYGRCVSFDVNSLYPYVLSHMRMPVGRGEWVSGEPDAGEDQCVIRLMTFSAELKPDGLPVLTSAMNVFGSHGRLPSTCGYITMPLTEVDWRLVQDNYDVSVVGCEGAWVFDTSLGLFDDYVNTWYARKRASDGRRRRLAKLMLNSLVGKFGTSVGRPILRLEPGEHGLEYRAEHMDAGRALAYLPVAAMVNAHARRILTDAIHANSGRFVYADTDGIILRGDAPPNGITVHPTKIGAWKTDHIYDRLRILGPRRYCGVETDGATVMRLSGVPAPDAPIPYERFVRGSRHYDGNGNEFVL